MPDTDSPKSAERSADRPTDTAAPYDVRNLPVPLPAVRSGGGNWFARTLRSLFGWKPATLRASLRDVLEAPAGETGFSPEESRMLKNILGLRERRTKDVMVPRADIVAVQQDISLGELVRTFETASGISVSRDAQRRSSSAG